MTSTAAPPSSRCSDGCGYRQGIPASEHDQIFEEFYQLDNPGRDRSKGVGLGLAIVQRLCELSGAQVSVHSEPGEGTCFRVGFPAVGATSEPAKVARKHAPTSHYEACVSASSTTRWTFSGA